ncbi:MAG: hypothetical protein HYZ73_07680 [Elusimicrobia bacterium]|nr:hypothetical protein [Elusimicrobiota bacterium]
MNRWQLIVAWLAGGLICLMIFTAPQYVLVPSPMGAAVKRPAGQFPKLTPSIDWGVAAQRSIPILLLGGLICLTLKGAGRPKLDRHREQPSEAIPLRFLTGRQVRIAINWMLIAVLVVIVASHPVLTAIKWWGFSDPEWGYGIGFMIFVLVGTIGVSRLGVEWYSTTTRGKKYFLGQTYPSRWQLSLIVSLIVNIGLSLLLGRQLMNFCLGLMEPLK